jgi:hypothetical protein
MAARYVFVRSIRQPEEQHKQEKSNGSSGERFPSERFPLTIATPVTDSIKKGQNPDEF